MDVAITGSTGLIGRALTESLRADGHSVIPVVRHGAAADAVTWDPSAGTIDAGGLDGIDAVVHLAGQPIAARPWTTKQRQAIHDSRQQGTTLLATTIAGLGHPPATLVSGSAIGYYGDRGDDLLTEDAPAGHDFLAGVCVDWESATSPAESATRVVRIRTGIVLDAHGGALAAQLPIFRLGLGGKAGRGEQWMPWITLHDHVRAIRFLLDTPSVTGAANLTGPNPATNAAFTKALGAALHRPTVLTVPAFARHAPLGIGPLVESLLLSSARVVPRALTDAGFTFDQPDLPEALEAVLGARS